MRPQTARPKEYAQKKSIENRSKEQYEGTKELIVDNEELVIDYFWYLYKRLTISRFKSRLGNLKGTIIQL